MLHDRMIAALIVGQPYVCVVLFTEVRNLYVVVYGVV